MAHCILSTSNTNLSLTPHPSFETPPLMAPLTCSPPRRHDDDLSLIRPSAISNASYPPRCTQGILSRQGALMIALIYLPRTDGKRDLHRAFPELRCKSRP